MDTLKLVLITNRQTHSIKAYLKFLKPCLQAGLTAIQLREKNSSYETRRKFAHELQNLLKINSIPLIINDDFELAKEIEAEGIHFGAQDIELNSLTREQFKKFFVGYSIENLHALKLINTNNAISYVAASAVFATSNKNNLNHLWGVSGLKKICARSQHPVIAIGGIQLRNTKNVLAAGAAGIAVISAIHNAENPAHATESFRNIIENYQ